MEVALRKNARCKICAGAGLHRYLQRTRRKAAIWKMVLNLIQRLNPGFQKIDQHAIRRTRVFLEKEMSGVNRSRSQVRKITRELIQKRVPPRTNVVGWTRA